MNPNDPSAAEVMAAEELLERFYGEPVRPIGEVCSVIFEWGRVCAENHQILTDYELNSQEYRTGRVYADHWLHLACHAAKSNFLARRLYGREQLRTVRCPQHAGRWSGLDDGTCEHGCGNTGWLPSDGARPCV